MMNETTVTATSLPEIHPGETQTALAMGFDSLESYVAWLEVVDEAEFDARFEAAFPRPLAFPSLNETGLTILNLIRRGLAAAGVDLPVVWVSDSDPDSAAGPCPENNYLLSADGSFFSGYFFFRCPESGELEAEPFALVEVGPGRWAARLAYAAEEYVLKS